MKYYNNTARQAGMTLIELTVVLLVLIGLAGLLIPYVSGFVSKTHDSTGTNNLAALNGNFARFENEYMRQPDNMESLIQLTGGTAAATKADCGTSGAGELYCAMMYTGFYDVTALNTASIMSLASAGIDTVLDMNPDTDNATFNSTSSSRNLMMAANKSVATVASDGTSIESHLADAFGGLATNYDSTCYNYVAFGVGDSSEMIGRTMNSAPIHFAQRGDMAAGERYNRFIAVYQVDKNNTAPCSTGTEQAKFIGTAMSMMSMSGHLWGAGHSAGHAYENLANN